MSRMGSKADVLASQNDVSSGSHSRHGSTERQDEECLLTASLSFRDCGNRLICPPCCAVAPVPRTAFAHVAVKAKDHIFHPYQKR